MLFSAWFAYGPVTLRKIALVYVDVCDITPICYYTLAYVTGMLGISYTVSVQCDTFSYAAQNVVRKKVLCMLKTFTEW